MKIITLFFFGLILVNCGRMSDESNLSQDRARPWETPTYAQCWKSASDVYTLSKLSASCIKGYKKQYIYVKPKGGAPSLEECNLGSGSC